MTTGKSHQHDAQSLRCRFAFGDAATEGVCRDWVAADLRKARLSLLFRAYYQIRALLPLPVRQFLQRHRRMPALPRWCYPDAFASTLTDRLATFSSGLTTIHPWPNGATSAFVLTHDIETADGLRRVPALADMEEQLGFRSSWNFVPHKYPIDAGLLRDLTARGFEIGVHGYNHDGRLFSSRSIFDRRVPAINAALKTWGAVGFRTMVHRNLHWLQSLDIQYDASCFDADPYQSMPGGVGSVWPFIAGKFVELPYTLPQDHTLFVILNQQDGKAWQDKLDFVCRLHGMSLVITHPDYLDSTLRFDAYRRLLSRAGEMGSLWHALPQEIATWWRKRDAMSLRQDVDGSWCIDGSGSERARPVTIRVSEAWCNHQPGHAGTQNGDGSPSHAALEWIEPLVPQRQQFVVQL